MKLAVLTFTLVSSVFAIAPIPNALQVKESGKYVANAYIVELSGTSAKRTLISRHEEVYHAIRKRGMSSALDKSMIRPKFLSARRFIFRFSSTDVAKLAEIPGVQTIRPIVKVLAPKPVSSLIVKDSKTVGLPDSYSTHVMTGVDKVHAEGNFGQGIKIGMHEALRIYGNCVTILPGIDYNHPLLGQGFGPGYKVIGGYDFVGDAYTGDDPPSPDDDPLDECNGHGTHVAGIIGASPNNTLGISGVASEHLWPHTKMDVLTMSLGGSSGWSEGTASVVASRIAAQGRVVTVAAGNDGDVGAWYTSDPGAGIGAISVASVDNIVSPVQNATVQGVAHDPIPYFMALPLNVTGPMPIYATSTNISQIDDACSPLPDSTPDLSSYLVIHDGANGFHVFQTQKLANVAAKGGTVALIYNTDTGSFSAISVGGYKAVLISAADGKFLVEQFIAKAPITVSFPQDGGAFSLPNPAGGLVSSFSTMGPTFDMYLSPALAAPGGNILSTLSLKLGGYGLESGTSMACPFVAGAAALILKALGTSPAVGLAAMKILQTTSASIASSHTDGAPLHTIAQQGAGLIQVDRAIHMESVVSPGQIALNDTLHFKAKQKNFTYHLHHVPAGTITTVGAVRIPFCLAVNESEQRDTDLSKGSIFVNEAPVPTVPAAAHVSFSSPSITVHPGQTKKVVATFTPPGGDNMTLPVYSGFIHVTSPAETLKVTYLGVAASLKAATVLDTTDRYFGINLPVVIDSVGNPQYAPTNYTFMDDDSPFLLLRLAFGCAKLRVDLDPFSGYSSFGLHGTFANGTRINDGQYRALLRALKVGGNANNEDDYESWLGPQFGVPLCYINAIAALGIAARELVIAAKDNMAHIPREERGNARDGPRSASSTRLARQRWL
ncbi:peptidase S8/S53 domain-containing protein [Mycena sp. CBHHK59/15]|nr:peptidase S8/S53 domain-containing protein [Mycena sp. CBHHK59/15]